MQKSGVGYAPRVGDASCRTKVQHVPPGGSSRRLSSLQGRPANKNVSEAGPCAPTVCIATQQQRGSTNAWGEGARACAPQPGKGAEGRAHRAPPGSRLP